MTALSSSPAGPLKGEIVVPGDKSISHRALMLGAMAVGETRITGLLAAEDVHATAVALEAMGARISAADDEWRVAGLGVGGLLEPEQMLDLGNSGTGVRLLLGLCASHPITTFWTGDASLRRRPMGRIMTPLRQIGARFEARTGDRLPLMLKGAEAPVPIEYRLPMASAQVKSAVLLAGLNTPGHTCVIEPAPTRDHTETMLRHFGAIVETASAGDGARRITVHGQPELEARTLRVPGDPSSAAFAVVAALIVPGSDVTIRNVGLNPLRTGLLQTLREMGADIGIENEREEQNEPVGDLRVRASRLRGIEVPPERAPTMIDEYPVLCAAAACAEGRMVMRGIEELRVKESDRIAMMARGLAAQGLAVEEHADGMAIDGAGGPPPAGVPRAAVATMLDHRIAMSFLIYGMAADGPVTIDDGAVINTSFPGFAALMNGLGARIEETEAAP